MTYSSTTPTLRQQRQAIQRWIFSASCRFTLLTIVVLFGILYIVETNSVSTKGYEISDLERRLETLQQEHQRLTVEIAGYRSMKSIEERVKGMNLVSATDVQYVNVVGTAVARR